jgi:hypothetical protein
MPKKIRMPSISFIPVSFSMNELMDDNGNEFMLGDGGVEEMNTLGKIDSEVMLLQMIEMFEDRDKIILLVQVLRDCGYDISHDSFAKALHMNRVPYMNRLRDIRKKINVVFGKHLRG